MVMEFTLKNILFVLIFPCSISFLFYSLYRLYFRINLGKPEKLKHSIWQNIWRLFKIAIGQTKIFRDKEAGWVHASIFWGFLIFLFSASESVFQGFYPSFSWDFLGYGYSVLTLLTELISVAIVVALIAALYRRFILKVKRLQGSKDEVIDALLVISFIFTITISLIWQNAAHIVAHTDEEFAIRPISLFLSQFFIPETANLHYEWAWWIHVITILVFVNYLPFSKHMHVYTSMISVFFGSENIPNKLSLINFEDENNEKYGATEVTDLTWRAILDGYSCTHCGRCTSVCPANLTGKILDPREIIVGIRTRIEQIGHTLVRQNGNDPLIDPSKISAEEQQLLEKKFIGDVEHYDAIWQCTTCGACMQECPVTIEHVPSIIEMRRGLVMMESEFPSLLQNTFSNIENSGNPWGFTPADRAAWADGLDVKIAAENPEFEYLFWVGCAGSFDDTGKKVSVAFTKLMQKAGIDFAILGNEETCNGDPARRAGNEYLADSMIKSNIEVLQNYNVKKIITTCPHCLNTLKNEYPDFGFAPEVIHHTEFLGKLISEGKIDIVKPEIREKLTYHDSCYLGRYNQVYDEPRNIISKIGNLDLTETKRNRDRGLCCGAGGAQMFMEETEGKRVNLERTEELVATGSEVISVNCPFCNIMISDGLKTLDNETVKVKDIAEIVLENVK
jgi:Fe-S oxidoreductase